MKIVRDEADCRFITWKEFTYGPALVSVRLVFCGEEQERSEMPRHARHQFQESSFEFGNFVRRAAKTWTVLRTELP